MRKVENKDESILNIEIDDPDLVSINETEPHNFLETRQQIDTRIKEILATLSKLACSYHGLDQKLWGTRLAELAWKAVTETKVPSFVRD